MSALFLLSFLLVPEMHHRPWVHKGESPARETLAASVGSAARGKKAGLTPGKRRSVSESKDGAARMCLGEPRGRARIFQTSPAPAGVESGDATAGGTKPACAGR